MKRKYRQWTDEQLTEVVKDSKSIAEVLRKLELVGAGGNFLNIKKNIDRLNLDISHFTGQGWNRGLYQNIGELSSPKAIKRLLIHTRGEICEGCKLSKWKEEIIPLELHHIDGIRTNNQENNLQLLCPNCHAFTDNYRGKNHGPETDLDYVDKLKSQIVIKEPKSATIKQTVIKKEIIISNDELLNLLENDTVIEVAKRLQVTESKLRTYMRCKNIISPNKSHLLNKMKLTKEQLQAKINEGYSLLRLSKEIGFSDNALRKWITKWDIDMTHYKYTKHRSK